MTMKTAQTNDIVSEIESLADFIAPLYDKATNDIYLQRVPAQPTTGDIALRFLNTSTEQETALSYVDVREWEIIYFGEEDTTHYADPAVFNAMDTIKKYTLGAARLVIPLNDGSLRYIRVAQNGFSHGAPVKTENGRWAIIGVLRTEVRRARDYETYEKIMETGVRTT